VAALPERNRPLLLLVSEDGAAQPVDDLELVAYDKLAVHGRDDDVVEEV